MASVRGNRASVPHCTHSSAGLTPTFFSTSFPVPFSKMKCDRLMLANRKTVLHVRVRVRDAMEMKRTSLGERMRPIA